MLVFSLLSLFVGVSTSAVVQFRAMSWNVYYKNLGAEWRMEGVADQVSSELPDILSIQEMWRERWSVLEKIRAKTGVQYELCDGGENQVKWWDGKIFYRADRWESIEDGVDDLTGGRGMTYAALRHKGSYSVVLVYGVHPFCCGAEHAHLKNMEQIGKHMLEFKNKYQGAPIVYMGDFNEIERGPAMKLLRDGSINYFNQDWVVPLTFTDSFREVKGWDVDATTFPGCGCRLDYIYRDTKGGLRSLDANIIWNSPGGSDHRALTADFEYDVNGGGDWDPITFPTMMPTKPLVCPEGSVQVGGINADINGCGLTGCSSRHSFSDIEDCRAACNGRADCVAFNWAPVGGDKLNAKKTVCSLYDSAEPNHEWGPNQIFCKIAEDGSATPAPEPSATPAPEPSATPATPSPKPSTPTGELSCAAGSTQVGTTTKNNDINGCGFHACNDRFQYDTILECKSACEKRDDCLAYNWAPKGGDSLWLAKSVCTLYKEDKPNHSWGPKQIFCRMDAMEVTASPSESPAPKSPTPVPTAAVTRSPTEANEVAACGNPGKIKKAGGQVGKTKKVGSACECERECISSEASVYRFHSKKSRCQCFSSAKVKKKSKSAWVVGSIY